jgi:hypothetical protein
VGQLIESHQLYKACCLLDAISQQQLAHLVELLAPGTRPALPAPPGSSLQRLPAGAALRGGGAAPGSPRGARAGAASGGAGAGGAPGRGSDAIRFLHFLPQLVQDLTATVEHLAMADFNNWLVRGS